MGDRVAHTCHDKVHPSPTLRYKMVPYLSKFSRKQVQMVGDCPDSSIYRSPGFDPLACPQVPWYCVVFSIQHMNKGNKMKPRKGKGDDVVGQQGGG